MEMKVVLEVVAQEVHKMEVTDLMLPESIASRLRQLTVDCDQDGIVELSEEIDSIDRGAAATIRNLAGDFRFDKLRAALDA